ncbi:MAG: ABC transporter substrate-binding protein [Intestinibacillus sp.]
MKAMIKRALALLMITVLLAGCTITERIGGGDETPDSGQTASADREPGYFGLAYYASEKVNPVLSQSQINRILVEALYEGLFVLDDQFQPQPVLCKTYSGDGITWTFTLQDGVTFWSGEPLRASDVVYTYKTAMKTETSPYYSRLSQIQSVEAVSDSEVRIVLKSPNTLLPALLDVPIFREGTETNDFSEGTGPYQPQSDGSIRWLVPFKSWREGAPGAFSKIELISTVRADAVVYSFETGDISLTRADRISATPATFKGAVEVYQTPTADLHYLAPNFARAPYQVTAVRQALSLAMDRVRLCTTQLQSFADPAVLPVNPQPAQSGSFAYSLDQDQEKALTLLASVGVSDTNRDGVLDYTAADGKRVPLAPVILVNSENTFKVAVAQQIISDLEQLGIRATLKSVSFEDYQTALTKGEYDFYYGETLLSPDFDVRPLIGTGGALNYGGSANSMTDTLIDQMRAAGGDSRVSAQQNFYQQFLNTMPILPIAFTRGQVIARGGLIENYESAPYQMFINVKEWKAG